MISDKGENLIFILSLPRSGSTLLSVILGNHSQVYCPPETWLLLRLAEVYGNPAENKIFDDCVASNAVKHFLTPEEFIRASRNLALTAYNTILSKTQRQIFVDKTPRYYHILDFIDQLFPLSKKIWLKRNPLDVAASYKTTWNRGIDYLIGDTLDATSFDFSLGLPRLIQYFDNPSPEKLEISYEELVMSPQTEIPKIARFCNISFEEAMTQITPQAPGMKPILDSELGDTKIKQTRKIHTQSVGTWQQHLNDQEIKAITRLLGNSVFKRMGYREIIDSYPHYFTDLLPPTMLEKYREQIVSRFQVIKIAQMATIYDYETRLNSNKSTIRELQTQLEKFKNENLKYSTLLSDLESTKQLLTKENKALNVENSQKDESIAELTKRIENMEKMQENLREHYSSIITHLEQQAVQNKQELAVETSRHQSFENVENYLKSFEQIIRNNNSNYRSFLEKTLSPIVEKSHLIPIIQTQLVQRETFIDSIKLLLQDNVLNVLNEIRQIEINYIEELKKVNSEIKVMNERIKAQHEHILFTETQLHQSEQIIQQKESQYLKIKSSYSYRLGRILLYPFLKINSLFKKK